MRMTVDARIVLSEPTGMGQVVHNVLSQLVKGTDYSEEQVVGAKEVRS